MRLFILNSPCNLFSWPLPSISNDKIGTGVLISVSRLNFLGPSHKKSSYFSVKGLVCSVHSEESGLTSDSSLGQKPKSKAEGRTRVRKPTESQNVGGSETQSQFPAMIPKKPRRGRRSEAAAVEDYVRDSLERTFASIREQNPEILEKIEKIMKEKGKSSNDDDGSDEDEFDGSGEKEMMVEEEDPDWPLDADIGWGIKASDYFEQHPIKNVVGEDGIEIDWEGEIDYGLVKEINCLEWESFAFHPSPLIVLVFERYSRASDNWKALKELEKAAKVYWEAKDRLPPRTVKIDIKIEKDLAYALKVKQGPQILFLRGNKILYRETEIRSADELVLMIAHFYYNAKKPSCINDEALSRPH